LVGGAEAGTTDALGFAGIKFAPEVVIVAAGVQGVDTGRVVVADVHGVDIGRIVVAAVVGGIFATAATGAAFASALSNSVALGGGVERAPCCCCKKSAKVAWGSSGAGATAVPLALLPAVTGGR
jgi:hypothetical protein